MIRIDFSLAIGIYSLFIVLLVFGRWIFYNYMSRDERSIVLAQNLRQCPYCTYIFFDYSRDPLAICPRCESLIETKTEARAKTRGPMRNNEKGAILIAVTVLTLVMMILVVSVVSLNVSQIKTNRHQAQRIKAEQIAKQIFWQNYSHLCATGNPLPLNNPTDIQIPIDGGPAFETYTYTITNPGAGPDGTETYQVQVDYPSQ